MLAHRESGETMDTTYSNGFAFINSKSNLVKESIVGITCINHTMIILLSQQKKGRLPSFRLSSLN